MPGYVIHIATANEYMKKHKNENINSEEFIKGVIFPDGVEDKSETHYGIKSSKSNLYNYLQNNSIESDFSKGYFLHLLTDYLFYNRYLSSFSKDIYNDYDILNAKLMEKYDVKLPKEVENRVFFKTGNLKVISYEVIIKMIEEISNMSINTVAEEVIRNPEKWTKMKD